MRVSSSMIYIDDDGKNIIPLDAAKMRLEAVMPGQTYGTKLLFADGSCYCDKTPYAECRRLLSRLGVEWIDLPFDYNSKMSLARAEIDFPATLEMNPKIRGQEMTVLMKNGHKARTCLRSAYESLMRYEYPDGDIYAESAERWLRSLNLDLLVMSHDGRTVALVYCWRVASNLNPNDIGKICSSVVATNISLEDTLAACMRSNLEMKRMQGMHGGNCYHIWLRKDISDIDEAKEEIMRREENGGKKVNV